MTIRTRFAPSPTGYLHIGGARTALFSWLFARKHAGQFILRIEDTDRERSTRESVDAILESMQWLGLDYNEGPIYQTQRFDRYGAVIQQLLDTNNAYHCYCTREELDALRQAQMARKEKPRYDGKCRQRNGPRQGVKPVVRFRNPDSGDVVIDDLVRGRISVSNDELDDLIIGRSDGTPTYNFTVVVDDLDMEINYVIRGDDHINNTPRQINIMRALGAEPPAYAHVPMILGADGARLSKRHGAVSVMQFKEEGFLPEALLNYLVRLGWSHGDQEVFTRREMIELFDLGDINHSASSFNTDKLLWLNHHYLKNGELAVIAEQLKWHLQQIDIDPTMGPALLDLVDVQRERCKTLLEMAQVSRFFFQELNGYDEKAAKKNLKPASLDYLRTLYDELTSLQPWEKEPLHDAVTKTAEIHEVKLGKVAQPLRVALSGTSVSPSIDKTLVLLGRDKTLTRISDAIAYIENAST